MKYKVTNAYCYLDSCDCIVNVFMINGLPFTFEDEGFDPHDGDIIAEANTNPHIKMNDLYRWSDYLISEEMHPILYEMSELIENYHDVPD